MQERNLREVSALNNVRVLVPSRLCKCLNSRSQHEDQEDVNFSIARETRGDAATSKSWHINRRSINLAREQCFTTLLPFSTAFIQLRCIYLHRVFQYGIIRFFTASVTADRCKCQVNIRAMFRLCRPCRFIASRLHPRAMIRCVIRS
jgi:hypothetical protein